MTHRTYSWIWIAAVIVGGCRTPVSEPDQPASQFLGLYAVNVMSRPTSVEGWNYRAPDGTNLASPLPKPMDLSVAHELRSVLFDSDSYRQLGAAESFVRDAGFRIYSDEKSVEILVSFTNDQFQIRTRNPGGQTVVQYASFAPVRDRMMRIVKGALPNFKLK